MRLAPLAVLVGLASAASSPALAIGSFLRSPYLEAIPYFGACDVTVTPANHGSTLAQVNDATKRVFCVQPGDYRDAGEILLLASGTQASRRFLRFDAPDGARNAVRRSQRAIFESIRIVGSWWVIQGLTVQPRDPSTVWFVSVVGGDHDVIDRNLVDGIDQPQQAGQDGIVITGYDGNPAESNSVQNNVVRNGDVGRLPGDYTGIMVTWGNSAGETNDHNKVLDNEVYDWGDGISLAGNRDDCAEPAIAHGSIIDGNDVYLTSAKRIDCSTGASDPNGDCACAENAIDLKPDPGADPALWTRVTNNRTWGFRPTSKTVSCGGSGSTGYAIGAGDLCPGHTIVAQNAILDSTIGVNLAGSGWIVAGNLIDEIRTSSANYWGSYAILASKDATNLQIQFNTVVGTDNAYYDGSSNTDTRCNAVIENQSLIAGVVGGTNHVTSYNYLYQSPATYFSGATNQVFALAQQSQDSPFCFWRKRWTGPEQVCIPYGSTTAASPHIAAVSSCNPDLGAPFGLLPITYPTTQPCSDGIDNDGDGTIDFDGGASAHGGTPIAPPDPDCATAASPSESGGACGLGAEVAGALVLLRGRMRRRRLGGG